MALLEDLVLLREHVYSAFEVLHLLRQPLVEGQSFAMRFVRERLVPPGSFEAGQDACQPAYLGAHGLVGLLEALVFFGQLAIDFFGRLEARVACGGHFHALA